MFWGTGSCSMTTASVGNPEYLTRAETPGKKRIAALSQLAIFIAFILSGPWLWNCIRSRETPMQTTGWYVWEPPGKHLTILFGLGLLDRLKAFLEKDFHDGREAGGVLLGRTDTAVGGTSVITLDDFLPMESDRRHGDFYSVAGKDRQKLRKELARRSDRREDSIVGFFRSHLRPGLYLDSADFSVMREFFSAPDNVALLVGWN